VRILELNCDLDLFTGLVQVLVNPDVQISRCTINGEGLTRDFVVFTVDGELRHCDHVFHNLHKGVGTTPPGLHDGRASRQLHQHWLGVLASAYRESDVNFLAIETQVGAPGLVQGRQLKLQRSILGNPGFVLLQGKAIQFGRVKIGRNPLGRDRKASVLFSHGDVRGVELEFVF
jgi:hypothetical protein